MLFCGLHGWQAAKRKSISRLPRWETASGAESFACLPAGAPAKAILCLPATRAALLLTSNYAKGIPRRAFGTCRYAPLAFLRSFSKSPSAKKAYPEGLLGLWVCPASFLKVLWQVHFRRKRHTRKGFWACGYALQAFLRSFDKFISGEKGIPGNTFRLVGMPRLLYRASAHGELASQSLPPNPPFAKMLPFDPIFAHVRASCFHQTRHSQKRSPSVPFLLMCGPVASTKPAIRNICGRKPQMLRMCGR